MGLPGIFKAIGIGIELGGIGAKAILAGWDLYSTIDNKDQIIDATERAGKIMRAVNEFTIAHHSALCQWSYEDFEREMFPAAMQAYKDSTLALQECREDGWNGIPLGLVPTFYHDRIESKIYYGFTKNEWSQDRSSISCSNRPPAPKPQTQPPPNKTMDLLLSVSGELIVGAILTIMGIYISRKWK